MHALDKVSLQIREGEMVTVLGPSGCGKTTLLNILAGFLAPTSGEVRLNGHAVRGPGAERGMVFQQGALFEWMTVSDNVAFGPRMAGRKRSEIRDIVRLLIDKVGLERFRREAGLPAFRRHAAAGGAGALPGQ